MKQLTIFKIFAESAVSRDFVIENFNHLHCFVRVPLLLLLVAVEVVLVFIYCYIKCTII